MPRPQKHKGPLSDIKIEFAFEEPQTRLLKYVSMGGGTYLQLVARQCLEVGGQRSGKTTGKLMYGIIHYCLAFAGCNILILRRTIPELKAGVIQDFKTFVPPELYDFNESTHVATFKENGSQVIFAGCVRGGSLIDTRRGLVPIERVTTRDLVLTRNGYKRVLWSGRTGVKPTISLGPLYLTAEHPVFCNGEFIPVREIVCRKDSGKIDHLLIQRSSYLKALSIAAGQMPRSTIIGTTLSAGKMGHENRFMSPFGKVLMANSQRAMKYITETETPSIIHSMGPIFNFSQKQNTENYTHMRDVTLRDCAPNAEPPFTTQEARESDFAESNAGTSLDWMKNTEASFPIASIVAQTSWELDERMPDFATISAASVGTQKISDPVPVYDLTVESEHEFFANGILVHNCATGSERDIEKYLGQAYPFMLIDECSQFSADVWQRLYARNLVNANCKEDKWGNLPVPAMVGCTNPIGAHWEYYHTLFVKREPIDKEEGMRKAEDGSYWVPDAGEWRCVYNPADYAYNHSTVLTNMAYRKRDPGIVDRLKALPKMKMEKFLLGLMDRQEGQYFDCFSEEYHVRDLRVDPEAVLWEDWQPVWAGQDFGVGHWNSIYLFTKAQVRSTVDDSYRLKTVCFGEVAPDTTGHTKEELANMLEIRAHYPKLPQSHPQYERISGKKCKLRALFFSHEKFSRVMEAHSPADEYSRLLRSKGLPSVSRATMDRIGSASFMYDQFKTGRVIILATCPGIIAAIPTLQRDPDNLDDVLKTTAKADDRYDGFRYGLYGGLHEKGMPNDEKARQYADGLDPVARYFYLHKKKYEQDHSQDQFKQKEVPHWMRPSN